jgi:hypothetical protein
MIFVPPHEVSVICHHEQPPRYGCLPSAYYAVTGCRAFLEHITEVRCIRMQAIALKLGWMTFAWFNGMETLVIPRATLERWLEKLLSGYWGFTATIRSAQLPGCLHTYGLVIMRNADGTLTAVVSDSQKRHIIFYEWDEFFNSRYSEILELNSILENTVLEDYPLEDPLEVQESEMRAHAAREEAACQR